MGHKKQVCSLLLILSTEKVIYFPQKILYFRQFSEKTYITTGEKLFSIYFKLFSLKFTHLGPGINTKLRHRLANLSMYEI